jgi:hypothetical protein
MAGVPVLPDLPDRAGPRIAHVGSGAQEELKLRVMGIFTLS